MKREQQINIRISGENKKFIQAMARARRQSVSQFICQAMLHEVGLSAFPADNIGWDSMSNAEVRAALLDAHMHDENEQARQFIVHPADVSIVCMALSKLGVVELQSKPTVVKLPGPVIKALRRILSVLAR